MEHLVRFFNIIDIFFGITHGEAYFYQELTLKRQDKKASENRFA